MNKYKKEIVLLASLLCLSSAYAAGVVDKGDESKLTSPTNDTNAVYTLDTSEDSSADYSKAITKYVWDEATNTLKAVTYYVTVADDEDYAITAAKTLTESDFTNSVLKYSIVNSSITAGSLTGYFMTVAEDSDFGDYSIQGDYIGNTASLSNSHMLGWFLYNAGDLGGIKGDFISNTLSISFTSNYYAHGTLVYNSGDLGYIEGDFIGNKVSTAGGAILGGSIYNSGTISSIKGDFVSNSATTTNANSNRNTLGGVINNANEIGSITGSFVYNSASSYRNALGGAIYNTGGTSTTAYGINSIVGDFIGNSVSSSYYAALGGAIYNTGYINSISGSFIGNYAQGIEEGSTYGGGAVYNTGTIGFVTSGSDMEFTGNYTKASDGTVTSNAIHNAGTVTFSTTAGYSITVNDAISGASGTIGISGAGSTVFNNTVADQTITVTDSSLTLGSYAGGYTSGDYTASASSANLSGSSLSLTNSTLTFAVSRSSDVLANYIVLGTTTLDSTSSLALDLTAIFGEFSISIDCSSNTELASALNTLLSANLEVITSEGTAIATSNESADYDYIVTLGEETLAEFNVVYENGTSIITISGTAVPEPSTYAMILGVLALGFAYYRRRK